MTTSIGGMLIICRDREQTMSLRPAVFWFAIVLTSSRVLYSLRPYKLALMAAEGLHNRAIFPIYRWLFIREIQICEPLLLQLLSSR
jgi:hypothetical protein